MNKRVLFLITLLILLSANISFADNANVYGSWNIAKGLPWTITADVEEIDYHYDGTQIRRNYQEAVYPSRSLFIAITQQLNGALTGTAQWGNTSANLSGNVSGNSVTAECTTLIAISSKHTITTVDSYTGQFRWNSSSQQYEISGTLEETYLEEDEWRNGAGCLFHKTARASFSGTFTAVVSGNDSLNTLIISGPQGTVEQQTVVFRFRGSGGQRIVGYNYRLDNDAETFTPEASVTLLNLSLGKHTFYVAAKDRVGAVDATPASRTFTVARSSSPDPTLKSGFGSPDDKQKIVGDPINSVSGNMHIITQDLFIPGIGLNFEFIRTYNSQAQEAGPMGYGWTHSYNIRLAEDTINHLVSIRDEQAKEYIFADNLAGSYIAQRGEYSTLVKNVSGFIWRKKDGKKYIFDLSGKLTVIQDRCNNAIAFTYDGNSRLINISDTVGRQIVLTYNANGSLTGLAAPLSRNITYDYGVNGNLIRVTDSKGNLTFYNYDVNHNLVRKIDAKGNSVYFVYDSLDRCISSTGESGLQRTTLAYDPSSKKTVITDSRGNITTQYYNNDSLVIRSIHPNSFETTSVWNENFNLLTFTNENVNKTIMEYDAKGNISALIDSQNNVTRYTYEPNFNQITSVNDNIGNQTTFTYDAAGNLQTSTDALQNQSLYIHNSKGQPVIIRDPLLRSTNFSYDDYGNLSVCRWSTQPATLFSFGYDDLGNLIEKRDARYNKIIYIYDSLNHLTQITYPDSSIVSYTYDEVGNRTSVTDANSRTTSYTYDQNNKVTSSIDPLGNTTRFAYDTEGNLTTVTDQNSRQTHYIYDSLNRLIEQEDALGDKTKFEYDAVGNLLKKTDAKGQVISYEYDSLNRLKKIIYPSGSPVSFNYDSLGRRTSMVDSRGTTRYTYDALSRVLSVDGPLANDTVRYTYDAVSNRATMVDPDGNTTRYTYDALNRLTALTDAQSKITNYTYDSLGNLTDITYPNGLKAVNTYDTLNRLLKLTQQKSATSFTKLNEFTYTYDAAGRRRTAQALDGSLLTYTYDASGRLTQEAKTLSPSAYQISYEYDSAGNRTRMLRNSLTYTYSYNELNQLTDENITSASPRTTKITVSGRMLNSSTIRSITVNNIPASFDNPKFVCYNVPLNSGANTLTIRAINSAGATLATKVMHITYTPTTRINYTYDLNGNLTQKRSNTKTANYYFDIENRLTKVNTNGKEVFFQYDAEGKRISLGEGGSSADYLYDASNCITERKAGVTTSSYLRNPNSPGGIGGLVRGLSPQGTVPEQYYLYNGQNSVTNLTNTTGAVTNAYDYDSFGNLITQSGTSSNSYRYSTKELDSTGLIYFGARYYDPRIGRFITPDPSGMSDGPNLYLYCLDDPIDWIDAWGLKVYIGQRTIFGPGNHTAIIIIPDDADEFKEDVKHFVTNSSGRLQSILSAGPGFQLNSISAFGNLTAGYNSVIDSPGNLHNIQVIVDPLNRSDSQLIRDILSVADRYQNNLPYAPLPSGVCYNSNSYTSGVLIAAGVIFPNFPWWQPGRDRPIPISKDKTKNK